MSDGALSFDHPLPLYTTSQVANALGLPLKKLNYWFYALPAKNRYQRFELKRRSGTRTRVIRVQLLPSSRSSVHSLPYSSRFTSLLPSFTGT